MASEAQAQADLTLDDDAGPVGTVVAYRMGVGEMLRETWHSRHLVPRLGIRVIVKGYSSTKLGRTWLIARPALSMFGMGLLFGGVLGAPSQGLPYLVFLLLGAHAWLAFEAPSLWFVRSFNVYRRIAKTLHFPLLLIPTAGLAPALLQWSIVGTFGIIVTIAYSIADGHSYVPLAPQLLLVPVGYLLALAVAYSLGLWLSVLNALARDVRIVFRFAIQIWMYVTPVIYPLSALPSWASWLAVANPVTAPVEMVRWALFGIGGVKPAGLVVTAAWIVLVGGGGLVFFARVAPRAMFTQKTGLEDEDDI
jgi:lipopolysaccharide transport system permease protein